MAGPMSRTFPSRSRATVAALGHSRSPRGARSVAARHRAGVASALSRSAPPMSRRAPTPSRPGPPARIPHADAVFTVGMLVRAPRVDHEHAELPQRPGRTAPVRFATTACRGTAHCPRCTSAKPTGPYRRWGRRRSRSPPRARPQPLIGRRPRSKTSPSAAVTAHTTAAEDDNPAPPGTSLSIAISTPPSRWPARTSAHTTPATYAAQLAGARLERRWRSRSARPSASTASRRLHRAAGRRRPDTPARGRTGGRSRRCNRCAPRSG